VDIRCTTDYNTWCLSRRNAFLGPDIDTMTRKSTQNIMFLETVKHNRLYNRDKSIRANLHELSFIRETLRPNHNNLHR
jgi:hypothetical protein